MLGGQGAEAHGNRAYPSASVNVGVNYVTITSYHSSLFASINLCGPWAASSPRPASLRFLLFPELGFSNARCLLATGAGGFRLSALSGVALGRRFRQEGVAVKKPQKMKTPR